MQIVKSLITSVLIALYQPFWYAVLSAALLCFLYLYAYHPINTGKGLKAAFRTWIEEFNTSVFFRKLFLLFFFTVMILFRTLLNRNMWANPVSNVIGYFGLHKEDGTLTTEALENMALFMPFIILLLWNYQDRIFEEKVKLGRIVWLSVKITFIFSFTIEMLQLFLRLGTWQLSDLFYNTLGGFLGGLIYWCGYKITHRKQD